MQIHVSKFQLFGIPQIMSMCDTTAEQHIARYAKETERKRIDRNILADALRTFSFQLALCIQAPVYYYFINYKLQLIVCAPLLQCWSFKPGQLQLTFMNIKLIWLGKRFDELVSFLAHFTTPRVARITQLAGSRSSDPIR